MIHGYTRVSTGHQAPDARIERDRRRVREGASGAGRQLYGAGDRNGRPPAHPRRKASSTFAPGRPVCGMPSLPSMSLIASRVLAPTLPSGSPTS